MLHVREATIKRLRTKDARNGVHVLTYLTVLERKLDTLCASVLPISTTTTTDTTNTETASSTTNSDRLADADADANDGIEAESTREEVSKGEMSALRRRVMALEKRLELREDAMQLMNAMLTDTITAKDAEIRALQSELASTREEDELSTCADGTDEDAGSVDGVGAESVEVGDMTGGQNREGMHTV